MGHTYKRQRIEEEKQKGRNGKHPRHKNNDRFHGIPITNVWVDEYQMILNIEDIFEDDVDSSINKQ